MRKRKKQFPKLVLSINKKTILVIDLFLVLLLFLGIFRFFILPARDNTTTSISANSSKAKQEARNIYNACQSLSDKEKCYKAQFTKLTQNNDIFLAQQTVYAIQDFDPILRHCHVLSHEIGKVAVRKNPSKWKDLMQQADVDTCGAGFFHGILEAHTGDDSNFKIDSAFINETCYGGKLIFKERTCAHIFGHLMLLETEGKIETALPVCGAIDESFRLDCYSGIFMEESFKPMLVEHSLAKLPIRDEKRMRVQEERCLKYSGMPGIACWIDLAEIFAEFYNYDAAKTYESCNRAPQEAERQRCYLKAVILMAISPNYNSKESLLSECAPYNQNEELYSQCTHFIISSLMHYSASFIDRGIKLCTNINDKYRETCFKDLGDQLTKNTPQKSKRQELCRDLRPEKYKSLCVN